jgi:hypothetical protein
VASSVVVGADPRGGRVAGRSLTQGWVTGAGGDRRITAVDASVRLEFLAGVCRDRLAGSDLWG